MSSRPPRTPKSDSTPSRTGAARTRQPGDEQNAASSIVDDSSLQRRELPSYSDSREARIAERAYWRAERRGFTPGQELDDWLAAEREVDAGNRSDGEKTQDR
mgnify:CR=1 FL=1|jgi:hypothetical protein